MKARVTSLLISALMLAAMPFVHAQDISDAEQEELRKQEAFRAGFSSIVADLDGQYFRSFLNAIDQQEMVDRIYGLRLIDQRVKRDFEQNLEYSWETLIQQGTGIARSGIMPAYGAPEQGAGYRLLGIESRGDLGRAVVRIDLANYQFNYQEFDLRLDSGGKVIIVDWMDFLSGVSFSESVGRYLVLASASEPALRKLLNLQNANQRELYLFGELMKATRDGDLNKFSEVLESVPVRLQQQPIVVESAVHLAKARRQRRAMVEALGVMAEYFPEEPRYSLMLLDYLFPQKKYEEGIAALARLADELDVEDAAMDARLSAAYLAAGNTTEAVLRAHAALEREPDLELGWLSTLNARNAAGDFAGAVAALTALESQFGYDMNPEKLEKSRVFGDLMASDEFAAWLETR